MMRKILLRTHPVIVGMIIPVLIFLSLTAYKLINAQEKKGVSSPPTTTPVPEQPPKVEKKQTEATPVKATPEESPEVEKKKVESTPIQSIPEESPKLPEKKIESTSVKPVPEEQKEIKEKGIQGISPNQPVPEEQKNVQIRNLQTSPNLNPLPDQPLGLPDKSNLPFTNVNAQLERQVEYKPFTLDNPSSIQPNDGTNYMVKEFSDFRGGLNRSAYKTKLAPNEALDLENALWDPTGELDKRPGYSLHSTAPETLNFLFRFYKECMSPTSKDTCCFLMGGSDTALYFCAGDSTVWHYLIGTGGVEGRWDGTTFDNLFVGTHEGIMPIVWDGDTLMELGSISDSFRINGVSLCNVGCGSPILPCTTYTNKLSFTPMMTGWTPDEWIDYTALITVAISADYDTGNYRDTVSRYFKVYDNDVASLLVSYPPSCIATCKIVAGGYVKLFSLFGVDTVWREGKVDSVTDCVYGVEIWDDDYTWDSTFNYNDYIFEVVGGSGQGFKDYLFEPHYHPISGLIPWNEDCLPIPTIVADRICLDSTTKWRIYKPIFVGEGAKYCESFDDHLVLASMGTGTEQNKNKLIWSELNDIGNFPPENFIIIESPSGDFITGMATFSGSYVDVPREELIVGQNNALYKIIPSATMLSGTTIEGYDIWTIATGVGVASNATMSTAEGKLLIFADQHGVFGYDRQNVHLLSQKIDPLVKEWDKDNLEDMSGIYNRKDRHYYLSSPLYTIYDTVGGKFITSFAIDSGDGSPMAGIYTQITTKEGVIEGDKVKENSYETWWQDIASDTAGNYAIIWVTVDQNIKLIMHDKDHNKIADTIQLNDEENKVHASDVSIDMNNYGKIIACWLDERSGLGQGSWDIYCQCLQFDEDTVFKVGSNFPANDNYTSNTGTDLTRIPDVAINDDSVVVIAWCDGRIFDMFGYTISAMLDTFPISAPSTNFRPVKIWKRVAEVCVLTDESPNTCTGYTQDHVSVAISNSTYIVTYTEIYQGMGHIKYRIRNISDNSVFNEGGIISEDYSVEPDVAMNPSGTHVITFAESQTGFSNYDIGIAWSTYSTCPHSGDTIETCYPAVAVDPNGFFTVVWRTTQYDQPAIFYRSYAWNGALMSGAEVLHSALGIIEADDPKIDLLEPSTITQTIGCDTYAWSFDHHGWSKESFDASAYCYQHSNFDSVKILFADPNGGVNMYGTQADDISEPVILTYQTGYMPASEFPSFYIEPKYFTFEGTGIGALLVWWYKNYSEDGYFDTLTCASEDCRAEMILPDTLRGYNMSIKIMTGTTWDDFTLSRWYLEYQIDQRGRK